MSGYAIYLSVGMCEGRCGKAGYGARYGEAGQGYVE